MAPSLSSRDLAALAQYLPDEVEALASADPPEDAVPQIVDRRHSVRRVFVPAWVVSALFHLALMLVLGLFYIRLDHGTEVAVLSVSASPREEFTDELEQLVTADEMSPSDELALHAATTHELRSNVPETFAEVRLDGSTSAPVDVRLSDFSDSMSSNSELLQHAAAAVGQALEGRSDKMRAGLLRKYGGTPGSERAVALALQWFAAHQHQDGSWNFEFRLSPCKGECSQPGRMNTCTTGATAMALLPFLGAGQTHLKGEYKDNVRRGIGFLLRAQGRNGALGSGGGGMYAHGLSAIVLCEAYAMTRDQSLKSPAQQALNYIVFAQHPVGGGWRYMPKQKGDTSAVAWQVMALKSGHIGHLSVPARTIFGVDKFLTSVQSEAGAFYGYMGRLPRPSTTAAGLLCRMYLGWDKHHEGLIRGVQSLSELGPAPDEYTSTYHMYYNYYATQVLRHFGGEPWIRWNHVMREHLVRSQHTSGHLAGSWTVPHWEFAEHDTELGGRLYYTSLATMILEVYYRHMPLYSEQAAEEFPL